MKIFRIFTVSLFVFFLLGIRFPAFQGDLIAISNSNYESLHELFFEWRKFEKPPLLNGAPDYTKSQFRKRQSNFKRIEKKLHAIDLYILHPVYELLSLLIQGIFVLSIGFSF